MRKIQLILGLGIAFYLPFIFFYPLSSIHSSPIESVYVFEYGKSYYPANLVNTLEKKKSVSMSWLFYLLIQKDGKKILVDSGFEDVVYSRRFALQYFRSPKELLQEAGFDPKEIHSVIVTHSHFDHIGGFLSFPNANLYIQRKEWNLFLKSSDSKRYFHFLNSAKEKLFLLDDNFSFSDSISIYETGGHTVGHQIVRFQYKEKSFIITGDECYFVNACYQKISLPSGAAYSIPANKKFLTTISNSEIILTLHDPVHILLCGDKHFCKL